MKLYCVSLWHAVMRLSRVTGKYSSRNHGRLILAVLAVDEDTALGIGLVTLENKHPGAYIRTDDFGEKMIAVEEAPNGYVVVSE